jgi:hypothetical protein
MGIIAMAGKRANNAYSSNTASTGIENPWSTSPPSSMSSVPRRCGERSVSWTVIDRRVGSTIQTSRAPAAR